MKNIKKLFSIFIMIMMIIALVSPLDTQAASKVKINKTTSTLYVGSSVNLKISGTKAKVKWSTTNKKIATVNNGKVTAKKAGTTTVNAKVGKDTYTCEVTVQNPYFNYDKLSLNKGKSFTLKLTGTKAKSWSTSNKKIVTVNSKGKVTAKKSGSATISVKGANGKTYKCKVYVENPSISTDNITLNVGGNYGLSINGTSQTVNWSSSNDGVATVNNGVVTAISSGTCTITATVNNLSFNCTVTVNAAIVIENPILDKSNFIMNVGDTNTLSVLGTTKSVTWSSSNTNVVTVSTNGFISAIASGNCTISAQVGSTTLYCNITVNTSSSSENPVLNNSSLTISVGDTNTLFVSGTTKSVTWSSSNTNVASVNTNGVVSAIASGTCNIYAAVGDITLICNVTVTEATHTHNYISSIAKQPTCTENGIKTYTCSICGNNKTEVIPATGHTESDWIIDSEPTCIENGYKHTVCTVCGEQIQSATIPTIDHIESDWIIGRAATCTVEGYRYTECTMCKSTMQLEPIAELGHNYVEIENTTTDEKRYGKIVYKCSNGGETKTDYVLNMEKNYFGLSIGDTDKINLISELGEEASYLKFTSDSSCIQISDDGTITALSSGTASIRITLDDTKTTSKIIGYPLIEVEIFDNKIQDVIDEIITEDMNDAEKVLAVHDWLCLNVEYDYPAYLETCSKERMDAAHTINGTLYNGLAVCEGYAKTFNAFMDVLGIPSKYIVGLIERHAWNQVELDGEWYWLDCTWDDTDDVRGLGYDYYLLNGLRYEDEGDGHDLTTIYLDPATGEKWRYLTFEKYLVTSETEVQNSFNEQQNNPVMRFLFTEQDGSTLESYTFNLLRNSTYGNACQTIEIEYEGNKYYLMSQVKE